MASGEDREDREIRQSKEEFLSRWSRLKGEAQQAQSAPQPANDQVPARTVDPKAPAPELPPIEKLTIDSDYRAFFHPKVGEDVRRAALKKLFADPHFNVMDGLDVYIDDYSKTEPIPPEMLAGLRQAQKILQWAKEDAEERRREELAREELARRGELQQIPADPADAALAAPAASSPTEIGFEKSAPEPEPVPAVAPSAAPSAEYPTQA